MTDLEARVTALEGTLERTLVTQERLLEHANANSKRLLALEEHTGVVVVHQHAKPNLLQSIPPALARNRASIAWFIASVLALALNYLAASEVRWGLPPSEVPSER